MSKTDKMYSESKKLYTDLADWWYLLSAPEDYKEEAEFFWKTINLGCDFIPQTVLELGSGGGNNAFHMKKHYEMTLVDLANEMLDQSRILNPECEHIQGDMRDVRLNRSFDAVFIHDAIVYMSNELDLEKAVETAFAHCKSGGVGLFVPDYVLETFKPSTHHGGNDGEKRGMRYLEWTYVDSTCDSEYWTEFIFVSKKENNDSKIDHIKSKMSLFPEAVWKRILEKSGFKTNVLNDQWGRRVFVGKKS